MQAIATEPGRRVGMQGWLALESGVGLPGYRLSLAQLDALAPFYLLLDESLDVVSAGRSILGFSPQLAAALAAGVTVPVTDVCESVGDAGDWCAAALAAREGQLRVWRLRESGVAITGVVMGLAGDAGPGFFLVGQPRFESLEQMEQLALDRRHFPIDNQSVEHVQALSALRSVEAELRQSNLRLEIKSRLLEQSGREAQAYLSVLAHEVRTPMTGVMGALELLGRSALDDEQKALLEMAEEASSSLVLLLDHILDYSSTAPDEIRLKPTVVDVGNFCDRLLTAAAGHAEQYGVELVLTGASGLPAVVVDGVRLRQVLLNLLTNAIKYRAPDACRARAELQVAVTDPHDGSNSLEICFSVIDNGIGIDPAFLPRLFDPFAREHARPGGVEVPGSGLGLSICRQLAAALGGAIDVHSELGHGSRFDLRLRLPRAVKPEAVECDTQRTGDDAAAIPVGLRVLLADDNKLTLTILRRQLEILGCHVTAVEDGARALAAAEHGHFDVVMADLQMPALDGFELAQALRARNHCAGLRLVASSAGTDPGLLAQVRAAGFDGLINKPTSINDLKSMLSEMSRSRVAADDAAAVVPPIDVAALPAALMTEDPAILDPLYREFADACRDAGRELAAQLAPATLTALAATAHRLKSSAGLVGAHQLAAHCAAIEAAGKRGDLAEAQEGVAAYSVELARVLAWIGERAGATS